MIHRHRYKKVSVPMLYLCVVEIYVGNVCNEMKCITWAYNLNLITNFNFLFIYSVLFIYLFIYLQFIFRLNVFLSLIPCTHFRLHSCVDDELIDGCLNDVKIGKYQTTEADRANRIPEYIWRVVGNKGSQRLSLIS